MDTLAKKQHETQIENGTQREVFESIHQTQEQEKTTQQDWNVQRNIQRHLYRIGIWWKDRTGQLSRIDNNDGYGWDKYIKYIGRILVRSNCESSPYRKY